MSKPCKWMSKPQPVQGTGWGQVEFFVDILLYYFINVMIKTYISSFIVVYFIYFTHSLCYVLMSFSLVLKNYKFSARNLSSPTEDFFFNTVVPLISTLAWLHSTNQYLLSCYIHICHPSICTGALYMPN